MFVIGARSTLKAPNLKKILEMLPVVFEKMAVVYSFLRHTNEAAEGRRHLCFPVILAPSLFHGFFIKFRADLTFTQNINKVLKIPKLEK